ncbi:unnamed protein product [Owenia fusiformis]|uniref:Proton-coupled folate transporter n=1 Tax=Owenia fusiformis TaxID=6347 RepID=A0A8J1UTY5_OWEFU|nr:unnamed protein product [Owenia fusiformis]
MSDEKTPLLVDTNSNVPLKEETKNYDSGTIKDDDTKADDVTQRKKQRLIVVEPVLFCLVIGALASAPLMQQYIYAELAEEMNITLVNNNDDNTQCKYVNETSVEYLNEQRVQQQTSYWMIYITITYGLPAIFSTMILGSYSDKKGRKICLILPIIGETFRSLTVALVVIFHLPLPLLLVGTFVSGSTGSFLTALAGCNAYITDTTSINGRTIRLVIMTAVLGVGQALAYIGTGYLVQISGFLYPFIGIVVILLLSLLYTVFLVPETVPKMPKEANLIKDRVVKSVLIFTKDNGTNRQKVLLMLLFIFLVSSFTVVSAGEVVTLYLLNTPLCFNSTMIGVYNAVKLVLSNIIGTGLLGLLQRCVPDQWMVIVGLMSGALNALVMGFAGDVPTVFIALVMGVFQSTTTPLLMSIASKQIDPSETGSLFGTISSVQLICLTLGGSLSALVYSATLLWMPGFVFFLLTAVYASAILLMLVLIKMLRDRKKIPGGGLVEVKDDSADDNQGQYLPAVGVKHRIGNKHQHTMATNNLTVEELKKIMSEVLPPRSKQVRGTKPQPSGSQATCWIVVGNSQNMVAAGNPHDEVYPGILLGDRTIVEDITALKELGVTHVLNAAMGGKFGQINTNAEFYNEGGIVFHGVRAIDMFTFKMAPHFETAAEFLDEAISKEGNKVYVHCHQGLSRSATLVIAFLMLKRQFTLTDAITLIRTKREIFPNDGFLRQLIELDNSLKEEMTSATKSPLPE